jgi:hypothetical protein
MRVSHGGRNSKAHARRPRRALALAHLPLTISAARTTTLRRTARRVAGLTAPRHGRARRVSIGHGERREKEMEKKRQEKTSM